MLGRAIDATVEMYLLSVASAVECQPLSLIHFVAVLAALSVPLAIIIPLDRALRRS